MPVIRILSTNLQNGGAVPGALAEVLDAWNPAVVAAQELAPNCAAVLEDRFAHGLLRPGIDFAGAALVGNRPLAVRQIALVRRTAMSGFLSEPDWEVGDGGVELLAVHLTNPLQRPLWAARQTRAREVESLLGRGAPDHARVVLGDMNATPAWPLYRSLAGLGSDAAREVGKPRRTWAPRWWQPALLRIDHAFVHGLRVVDVNRARIRGSDHRALIVDLEIGPDSTGGL